MPFEINIDEYKKTETPKEYQDGIGRAWELGKMCSLDRIRNKKKLDHKYDWNLFFSETENKISRIDQKCRLYYCQEAFYLGYYFPGLGTKFVHSELAIGYKSFSKD